VKLILQQTDQNILPTNHITIDTMKSSVDQDDQQSQTNEDEAKNNSRPKRLIIEHIGISYEKRKKSYRCRQFIYKNKRPFHFLSRKNYYDCVAAAQRENENKILNDQPVDPFIGEKMLDIKKSKTYPNDGLYYNQRNKLWYVVAFV
jgi:hypothetical protein